MDGAEQINHLEQNVLGLCFLVKVFFLKLWPITDPMTNHGLATLFVKNNIANYIISIWSLF